MKIATYKPRIIFSLIVLFYLGTPNYFTQSLSRNTEAFIKNEVMIPMRDGVKLYTEIYIPKNINEPLPIIINRTPYQTAGYAEIAFSKGYKPLVEDGYIFVFQDIRGCFKSGGKFIMLNLKNVRTDENFIDESTDAYDTFEWLIKNVDNNNGRIGIVGTSYDAWLSLAAAINPHPSLKAVIEEASPADMFLGDDFHHNGAFRLSYSFEYSFSLEDTANAIKPFSFDKYDTYDWFLNLGALSNVNEKYFHGKIASWNNFVYHPSYDSFWQDQSLPKYFKRVAVPTLNVAGWWDQEDFYGPLKIYETLEKYDSSSINFLVIGPWYHGSWNKAPGNKLGKIDLGDSTSNYYQKEIRPTFFAYYLKDKGKHYFPEALTFQTGSNKWQEHNKWNFTPSSDNHKLYLHSSGTLSFDPTFEKNDDGNDSYISDPKCPIPYRSRPIESSWLKDSRWKTWLVEDQRFVHLRPDVLSYQSEPLTENLTITGNITAHLFASTTGTDSDWIIKLIDVYPDIDARDTTMSGYQLMIANEVFRGRFYKSFEKPEPMIPNTVNEYIIDLHSTNHCFLKGHKIMVQIQSTWFPLIDINPQKFVDNIFEAKASDFQTAVQNIYRSEQFPSHIVLPIQ